MPMERLTYSSTNSLATNPPRRGKPTESGDDFSLGKVNFRSVVDNRGTKNQTWEAQKRSLWNYKLDGCHEQHPAVTDITDIDRHPTISGSKMARLQRSDIDHASLSRLAVK